MSPHVTTLRLFPGITSATVKAFFMPPIRGVVLETFGAGNAPQRVDILNIIKSACDRGVVVVAISQCTKGSVSDAYETGRTLLQSGVVPGCDMTPECALTKLSYLLSKPELDSQEIRKLMGTPLRGELTRTSLFASEHPTLHQNMENIQGILSHFIRLSQSASAAPPTILISPSLDETAQDAAAPWTWTAAEAASTEAVLYPFLLHLAAARNDTDAMNYCISSLDSMTQTLAIPVTDSAAYGNIAGGIVNCLEPGSGRPPLHVAALNGNIEAVQVLLQSGALVHLRDNLGHTALYYAARQGHESVVDLLIRAGATLGGLDGTFVQPAMSNGQSEQLWLKVSANTQPHNGESPAKGN